MTDGDDGPKEYQLFEKGKKEPRTEPFKGSRNFTGEGLAKYVDAEGEWSDTYKGLFIDGRRQGKGIYTFKANGDRYEGQFEDNCKHGFGKMTYEKSYGDPEKDEADPKPPPRGGTYLGYYDGGQRGTQAKVPDGVHSEGTFTFANGDIYVGQWRSGKKHGKGTYTYGQDDTKLVGDWEDGRITNGRWIFPNGMFYAGKFRCNKPFGKGVWVLANGNQLVGEYVQKDKVVDEDVGDDPDPSVPKPMPQVWCYFKHGKATMVHGGTMFKQKPLT
mmetsp:Transcript_96862/g.273771  ORF Transcript_96862/g.273771 Transcript_96862/m.273771 type:complete len:272 (+) Transcript_96862:117-932(+)